MSLNYRGSVNAPQDSAKMFKIFGEYYSEQTRNDWEAGLEFRDGRKEPKPKSYYKHMMEEMGRECREYCTPKARMQRKMQRMYDSMK